ncbi:helix-turn-helix domain-containing protein [Frankia tisae]|uniref:helix-turn-helix domain-containing protein n=2 Tax=Frankia tisae TaxID=2950104 RepID=UPI0021BDFFC8|nr:helix-turn-helix transcriptional regulator [Frankia tisae]
MQARAARVRATVEFKQGRPRAAHALLTAGARHVADTDVHLELRMQLTAVNAAWSADDLGLLAVTASRLDGLHLAPDDRMTPIHTFLIWMTSLALERTGTEWPPLGRVVTEARESSLGCPHDLSLIGVGGLIAGHERETRDVAAAVAAESRLHGRVGWLTAMLSLGAAAQVLLGEHRESRVVAQEALQLALDTGQTRWIGYARGILAYLAAVAGDETGCRALAAEALDSPVKVFKPLGGSWADWALTVLELGAGRPGAAVGRLNLTAAGPARLDPPLLHGIPDGIEAWVRLGRVPQAAAALSRLERWASHIEQPSVDALVRRCRALLASDATAEDHYRAALDLHELAPRPFEHARTALLYGEWLRRRRRKADARPPLSRALGAFEDLGARFWVRRAAVELGATQSRPSSGSAAGAGLTPQELQVGRLAAEGLSDRDIAAQLFLSPRTVGYHLNKAYHKLGVRSRAELAGLALGGPTTG